MKGRPKNKIGAAFGSDGWSGQVVKLINKELEAMELELIGPGVKILYVPDECGIHACHMLSKKIAEALPKS